MRSLYVPSDVSVPLVSRAGFFDTGWLLNICWEVYQGQRKSLESPLEAGKWRTIIIRSSFVSPACYKFTIIKLLMYLWGEHGCGVWNLTYTAFIGRGWKSQNVNVCRQKTHKLNRVVIESLTLVLSTLHYDSWKNSVLELDFELRKWQWSHSDVPGTFSFSWRFRFSTLIFAWWTEVCYLMRCISTSCWALIIIIQVYISYRFGCISHRKCVHTTSERTLED